MLTIKRGGGLLVTWSGGLLETLSGFGQRVVLMRLTRDTATLKVVITNQQGG